MATSELGGILFIYTPHGRIEVLGTFRRPYVVKDGGWDEPLAPADRVIDCPADVDLLAAEFANRGQRVVQLFLRNNQLTRLSGCYTALALGAAINAPPTEEQKRRAQQAVDAGALTISLATNGLATPPGKQTAVRSIDAEHERYWANERAIAAAQKSALAPKLGDLAKRLADVIDNPQPYTVTPSSIINENLLDQHRDETTVKSPKLRADIRGLVIEMYEEGKRRGAGRHNVRVLVGPRARAENLPNTQAVKFTCEDGETHAMTEVGKAVMNRCVEQGAGIAARADLGPEPLAHLDEDLLADDAE